VRGQRSLSPDIFNTEVTILYLSWLCRRGVAWGRSKFAITSWNLNICAGTKKFVPRQFQYKSDRAVFIMPIHGSTFGLINCTKICVTHCVLVPGMGGSGTKITSKVIALFARAPQPFFGFYMIKSATRLINSGNLHILREGPHSQGASWGVCGSGVPPYDFLNLYGVSDSRFSISSP
jgi:hypothetical protein